jgi:hypothetical protein
MLIVLLLIVGITVAANAQERPGLHVNAAQPKVDIKVSKQVDDHGNVVKYDSVYTWSYSSGNIPADLLLHKSKAGVPAAKINDLYKYTDSLWRSMLQPINLLPMGDVTRNLLRSMEEALQRLPQQQQRHQHSKQSLYHEPGGKKSAAKATRTVTI